MSELLHLDLPHLIETAGYIGLFLIIFAESGLFFGFFLPGDSLLFTAGFLASQGLFNIWLLIPLMVVAAILGDSVGYWTGKKVGPHLFKKPDSLIFSKKRVEQAHVFFERHGGMSIILARFIPAVRTFTPIVAGVARMSYPKFLSYNVIGGFIWAMGFPLGGYFLGSVIPDADKYVLPIVGGIIVLSIIPIIKTFFQARGIVAEKK